MVSYSLQLPQSATDREITVNVIKAAANAVGNDVRDIKETSVRSGGGGRAASVANNSTVTIEFYEDNRYIKDWVNYLSSEHDEIIGAIKSRNKRVRDPTRSYQHMVTDPEFALLVKALGTDKILEQVKDMTNPYGDVSAMNTPYQQLLTILSGSRDQERDANLDELVDLYIGVIRNYIRLRDKQVGLKYGDTIRFSFMTYRNTGLYICMAAEAIGLDSYPDDYGNVPAVAFPAITEFPIKYFSEVIDHNEFVWLPKGLNIVKVIGAHTDPRNYHNNASYQHVLGIVGDELEIDELLCVLVIKPIINHVLLTDGDMVTNSPDNNNSDDYKYIAILYEDDIKLDQVLKRLVTTGTYGQWIDNSEDVVVIETRDEDLYKEEWRAAHYD